MYKWLIGRCNNSGAASTCASTKEAATRASSCIILRVSCYHHCTINLFGDQSERDNHPTIDSLTYGGNPMITSRHATHHHKNVSKHSLSKSRSDIGHRVIYLATLCNTMQHYHIATASAVYIISYKLNLESKIDNYSEDSNTWACSASTSASTEEASRRTRASTWRNATGIGSSRTLKQSDNHRRNTFLQSSAWPTCSTFSKHAWSPRSCLHLNRCQTGYRPSWLLRLEEYDKCWLPSTVTTAMPCQRGHLGLQQSTLQDTFDFT